MPWAIVTTKKQPRTVTHGEKESAGLFISIGELVKYDTLVKSPIRAFYSAGAGFPSPAI
jgi:hypothetical protein